MPDYDYRVDTSLCQAVNAVTATTGIPRSLVLEMVQRGNTTTENAAGPFSHQRLFCDSQRNGHILMGHSCRRRNIQ